MIGTFLRTCLSGIMVCQLLTGGFALAGPKEDVAAASMKWAGALGENDPDQVLPFYAKDAVLWGTLSPTVRSNPAALRELIRVYGGTAVNTGYYTFSFVRDGESKTLPARYSFTYVKQGKNWMIVDHHSSAMPQPPK